MRPRKRTASSLAADETQTPLQRSRRASLLASSNRATQLLDSASSSTVTISADYQFLGACDQICEFCGATFWFAERIVGYPLGYRPRYNICCRGGKVRLQYPLEPPSALKSMFADSAFLTNIRAYNSMFSMTSFGAKIDESINRGGGPYVFKVSGQVSHWIGSVCPPPGLTPRFLQLYVYDTNNEIQNRMSFFVTEGQHPLSADIVHTLTTILDEHNGYVCLLRTARDIYMSQPVTNFSICIHNRKRETSFDQPVPGTLGAILVDDTADATDFDIIITPKNDHPRRVSKLHPSYMALQYPLLFPYGEHGWSPELRLHQNTSQQQCSLTMNMYYSYQLHDRENKYTLLLNSGRLFQQYIVDAYVCIEQSRLEYIQQNQNLFRTESLRGVHDALSRGETTGRSIGKRIILPSSFTGGPRYMYKHYQDALAICRVYGHPQYFITFTCNVSWPELRNYNSSTIRDRPDIIARVFRMKVNSLLRFLKERKPFGDIAAELYTIEFQKRGLPHCHILVWVIDAYKIRIPADVDSYITAELPNKDEDPELYQIITETMMHGPCGLLRPNSPCMQDGVCSKRSPKSYEKTTRFDKEGYVHYKRSNFTTPFMKGDIPLDNGYVVLSCPF